MEPNNSIIKISSVTRACLRELIEQLPRITSADIFVNLKLIENIQLENIIQCPCCFEIPRCPIILPCGHIECPECFLMDFKHRKRETTNFKFMCECPNCRKEFDPSMVHTLEDEIKMNSTINAVVFYKSLKIVCSNVGCKQSFHLDAITKHETQLCLHRLVACPAALCQLKSTAVEMFSHINVCPFHLKWCNCCEIFHSILLRKKPADRVFNFHILHSDIYLFLITIMIRKIVKLSYPVSSRCIIYYQNRTTMQ